ncbi:DUF805 domain-containing protein [Candidatus Nomurabacteria bacterium]|uniref:DUF805 domain-containing protein n=1 Tax=candidate division WWE3 bacterium TaxID=2053526 RepID=A0A955E0W0_UNCKA|nr:DUF805 domain-containing protein [candidate division WWE3 bacterium]MCB9823478.1 DUF805 domain-containing protein [Candidatus Nomurabacteria bacterium]MCB9827760.1 DUF805 domain-containing protein [Candidatus Nomurabacteria bacterium]HXK52365.1 DUF805 domain-containing protein [bacterium]
MDWYITVLKKYADFSGRAGRSEYWMFQLINVGIYFALAFVMGVSSNINTNLGAIFSIVYYVYMFAVLIPSIAVSVRRLHDTNKSGWLLLLSLIPFIGGIIVFVFTVLPSDAGPNAYGEAPAAPVVSNSAPQATAESEPKA